MVTVCSLPKYYVLFVKEKGEEPKKSGLRVGLSGLSPKLKLFMAISTMYALANFSYMFFVLRASPFFEGRLAVAIPILLFILYNAFYSAFALPAGMLSDRIGREKALLLGYLLFPAISFAFLLSGELIALVLLFILLGLNYAFVNVNERAFVSDLSERGPRGTALGTYHMAISIAALPAGLAAGLLWDVSPSLTFLYGGALSLAAVLLFAGFSWRYRDYIHEHHIHA